MWLMAKKFKCLSNKFIHPISYEILSILYRTITISFRATKTITAAAICNYCQESPFYQTFNTMRVGQNCISIYKFNAKFILSSLTINDEIES